MASALSYTLSELARRLDTSQHRLIHLCEKGVIVPEVSDAAGRGSSRAFSSLNYLELAVALRLRDMFVPVSVLRGIVHVLRGFGRQLERTTGAGPFVDQLREPNSPELRIILSDGTHLFFSLGSDRESARLFGGIPLDKLVAGKSGRAGATETAPSQMSEPTGATGFGGPEGSEFVRLELSVNAVARSLQFG